MGWEEDAKRREEERVQRAREFARKQREYDTNKRAEQKAKKEKIAREQRQKEERDALDHQIKEIQDRFELEKAKAKEGTESGPRTSFLATSAIGFLGATSGNSNRPRTQFGNPMEGYKFGPNPSAGQQRQPEGSDTAGQNSSASSGQVTNIPKLWRPF